MSGLLGANAVVGGVSAATLPENRGTRPLDARTSRALKLRLAAAELESQRPSAIPQPNGDETLYPNLIGTFTKGLPHSQLGEVDLGAYQSLMTAITSQSHADAEKIQLGLGRKFVDIEASFAYNMDGADTYTFSIPPAPAFNSAQIAAEMVELYWQALARDIPFTEWDSSPVIQAAAAELNGLSGYRGPRDAAGHVTTANVFRGYMPGNTTGPYTSQYLLQTIYWGSTPREQMYRTGMPGVDFMTDYSEWLLGQSGLPPYRTEVFDPTLRYIRTPRDLAQFVHWDCLCQSFLQASLILLDARPETLLNYNLYQLSHTNPYKTSRIQTGFATFGAAHIQDWVTHVALLALKATWNHKWAVHRRLRPEAFGGRVYNTLTGAANYPIHRDLLNSQALRLTVQKTGGSLLPQAYVEGAPLHPSYPAAHATVAGACVTLMKAFFEETSLVSGVVVPTTDGLSLTPSDGLGLTIGGELNKLAFNVAMARNFAGIHYRSDADAGLAIGEEVAICFLKEQVNTFTETFQGFAFTKFDGTKMLIAPG
ncbi:MAG: vanadium-dependent haloperoxidase [Terriglobia bacterium]